MALHQMTILVFCSFEKNDSSNNNLLGKKKILQVEREKNLESVWPDCADFNLFGENEFKIYLYKA
jgi:hypothetical protein